MKKKLAEFLFGDTAKENLLMVWANQKGGAGKSTLCIAFADLWVKMTGRDVVVIDADPQRTLYKVHMKDIEENPGIDPLYHVYPFGDIDDADKTVGMMNKARLQNCDIIFDAPGNLSSNGIAPLLMKADCIFCPTGYDNKTSMSTIDFSNFITASAKELGLSHPPRIFYIINRFIKSWGTKKELEARKTYDEYLSALGLLTPRVPSCAKLQRTSTFYITPKQEEAVKPCFSFIIKQILGT